MMDVLESLWRELLGSSWVLYVLPILVLLRWLLISRRTALAAARSRFFEIKAWNVVLAPPEEPDAHQGKSVDVSLEPGEFRRRWFLELVESAVVALFLVFFIIRPFVVQAFYIPSPSMVETLEVNDRILVNKFIYKIRAPQRGDIVVFQPPRRATDKTSDDWIKRVIGIPGDRISVHANHLYLNGVEQTEDYVALLDRRTDKGDMEHEQTGEYDYVFPDPQQIDLKPGQNAYVYPASPDAIQEQQYRVEQTTDLKPRPLKDPDTDYLFFVRDDPKDGLVTVVPDNYVFVMGDNRNDSEDSHYWGYLDRRRVLGEAFAIFWPPSRIRVLSNPHH